MYGAMTVVITKIAKSARLAFFEVLALIINTLHTEAQRRKGTAKLNADSSQRYLGDFCASAVKCISAHDRT